MTAVLPNQTLGDFLKEAQLIEPSDGSQPNLHDCKLPFIPDKDGRFD
jgi:hypothetical protein